MNFHVFVMHGSLANNK
uniref:Uncharacterized protein n=1 Tax=Rhizophora mucronata TaxID=61149 RepID=A0A2P2NXK2_RHIMU